MIGKLIPVAGANAVEAGERIVPMRPTLLALSRRHFVIGSGMAIGGFGVPVWAQTPSVAPDGFRILPIRPAALATDPPNGTWGYDGMAPGPTLRVRRGEELRVRLINGM